MPDTLSQLISKVQAQMLDDGTFFSEATCTAALRQSLHDINRQAPLQATVLVTALAGQREYELSDEDPDALSVTGVLLARGDDSTVELPYSPFVEDERVFFRLHQAVPAGAVMIVHYTRPHTISGLDGATDSTVSDRLTLPLVDGACTRACLIRAAATIDSNNLEPNASTMWLRCADNWRVMYTRSLARALRDPAPRGEPSTIAWNDRYHSEQYP